MPQKSKAKLTAFTDANVQTASENASVLSNRSSRASLENRKKQAEEPIYLSRM
jgi:hypothetical protein